MKILTLLIISLLFTPAIQTQATPFKRSTFHVGVLLAVPLLYANYHHHTEEEHQIDDVKQFNETIVGKIGFSLQQAFEYWEQRCDSWKLDVQERNGNRLKSVNCGDYKREIVDADSDAQRFVSQGSLVLRIKGKRK